MAKEKSINPAQAQRKLEKQKAVKKGKAEQLARRNERLAQRNPERLQRQADELRAVEASGEALNNRDKKLLEELERDEKAIRKAREALGERAPQFPSSSSRGGHGGGPDRGRGRGGLFLGKRRRDEGRDGAESEDSATESVKAIPMPRDTPPPIPADVLRKLEFGGRGNANFTPLQGGRIRLPPRPAGQEGTSAAEQQKEEEEREEKVVKKVYEAVAVLRDLRKEAVSKFVPSAVRQKIDARKGIGGKLLEPEELEKLEQEGYTKGEKSDDKVDSGAQAEEEDDAAMSLRDLEEEQRNFEREIRAVGSADGRGDGRGKAVQMEEVEDEGS